MPRTASNTESYMKVGNDKQRRSCIPALRPTLASLALLVFFLAIPLAAHASVAFLMEEPYGDFGAFNPTGHSAVYLSHICAAAPTELRMCRPGEFGVVISRYHKIHGYDWIAVPLIPYLYAVDTTAEIPTSVDKAQVASLRDAYRREHMLALAPDDKHGRAPGGEWTQLVGSSYDRKIHGFQVESTTEQDERFIAIFNDKHNVGHFNLFFHNCADFSHSVLDLYLPNAIHRNFIADIGLSTPKQVARSLMKYGKNHPEVRMSAFVIPQVTGSLPRSHAVDGVVESLVKSKKYILPIAVLSPAIAGGAVVAYLTQGRMALPKDATVFNLDDAEIDPIDTPSIGPLAPDSIGPESTAVGSGASASSPSLR
ncbi:MAG TPA: hypothetical protein VGN01_02710 [Acidobacteriaceae bacterium]